ncbi:L-ectoine synthase [Mycolicibacterium doricum]|uniref:L-ectoine synthase n=1 Tax=Mycolicibacterium doricum TaxID=126673 RepID=A0A1X1T2S1_9MYCO|nr:ectoine synthase [Mycolicibacterium doricum]MCV7268656.1 ectoine synthase [Mycolicibacterium doricum]ORV38661.1 L-ectoine synthase [Mycolicibacterium doricum]BBZ06956.1 L-ectoine synthase [Mycolicibacterium doricum]
MFARSKDDVTPVEWGSGTSHRLLVDSDNMGFALAHTLVRAGTESKLEYRRHLEACYCIKGSGSVADLEGNIIKLRPGVLYALDQHDRHYLRACEHEDMELISVFTPPIRGDEQHILSDASFSSY